jgi:hypothetical protein
MTVIAMTREVGSLGTDVAAGLAEELRLKIIHSEIVANHSREPSCALSKAGHRYWSGGLSTEGS